MALAGTVKIRVATKDWCRVRWTQTAVIRFIAKSQELCIKNPNFTPQREFFKW